MQHSIIIIEDDADLRDGLVDCLGMADFKVHGVGSALEYYKAADSKEFTVAVVDIGLPDQSGLVLAKFIRENTSTGIIILTARSSENDRVEGYESGADIYLVKPVRCVELTAAVKSLVRRRESVVVPECKNHWTLNSATACLISPLAHSIRLTHKELLFVATLSEQPENLASRDMLLEALNYQVDDYGNRALNSLVMRLRKKIESATDGLSPIKTAHTMGLYFDGQIEKS